jgi:serine-type D-Ala-D-Ala carboxypeptidase/endopeptidase (penicillin-binding protein 4)
MRKLILLLIIFPIYGYCQSGVDLYFLPAGKNSDPTSVSTKAYVPASIVKLVTAAHALYTFGGNYQFPTKIYLSPNNELVIEGYGDPVLTSESLRSCLLKSVQKLSSKKVFFDTIILDGSKFDNTIQVPGQGGSSNPYDANVGALALNFNSIAVRVKKKSKSQRDVISGEAETPLTPYAKQLAQSLPSGNHRISIRSNGDAERQLYEVASILLQEQGIRIKSGYLVKPKPEKSELLAECYSEDLEKVLHDMLKYSNNFSANQIFLNAGARYHGYPANLKKSSLSLHQFLREEVGIKDDFVIEEGAGLSRSNVLTPQQIIIILKYFEPYRQLLPETDGVFYKSGTLKGVSNLAGYLTEDGKILGYFSLFGSKPLSIPDRVKLVSTYKKD